jgi:hypothetical protein
LSFVVGRNGRHGCRSHLKPDEFPVEVEVIADELAISEGGILNATLCEGMDRQQRQKTNQHEAANPAASAVVLVHVIFHILGVF